MRLHGALTVSYLGSEGQDGGGGGGLSLALPSEGRNCDVMVLLSWTM